MEAAVPALDLGTGTATMAAQLPADVAKYSGKPALRHKVGDEWRDISYDELGDTVREVALGLVDLGIEPRDKVAILSHTRPEWTIANYGILTSGATSVSIYQTNSPEECHYVADHSESRASFVEDGESARPGSGSRRRYGRFRSAPRAALRAAARRTSRSRSGRPR